jgi:hypothetical protein
VQASSTAPAKANPFGAAKPVDTAKKLAEVESKLASASVSAAPAKANPFGAAKPVDKAYVFACVFVGLFVCLRGLFLLLLLKYHHLMVVLYCAGCKWCARIKMHFLYNSGELLSLRAITHQLDVSQYESTISTPPASPSNDSSSPSTYLNPQVPIHQMVHPLLTSDIHVTVALIYSCIARRLLERFRCWCKLYPFLS